LPYEQTSQTGAMPVAAAQVQQTYTLVVGAGQTVVTDAFMLRGMSRLLVLYVQTAGAVGAQVQLRVATRNQSTPVPDQRAVYVTLGGPAVVALNVPLDLNVVVPGKYVHAAVTAPAGNDVTIEVTFMASL
jgi:hypothetical protein